MARKLSDLTLDEQNRLEYPELCEMRRAAWREHLASMQLSPAIREWADRMADRYGPKVKVHANALSWPLALLIARYGEAMDVADPDTGEMRRFWPDAFTADDEKRALEWEQGITPFTKGVQPLYGKATAPDRSVPFGLDEED